VLAPANSGCAYRVVGVGVKASRGLARTTRAAHHENAEDVSYPSARESVRNTRRLEEILESQRCGFLYLKYLVAN